MNPDAKQKSTHGWYEERTSRAPRTAGAAPSSAEQDKPKTRRALLALCQGVAPEALHRATVMRWIGMGADIHRTDTNGLTVLMFIAQGGDLELVRYLVGQGMRVNADDGRGFTALAWAAWYEHREVVHYLKSRGATINIPALMFAAARTGRVATLHLLQQVGARLRYGSALRTDGAQVAGDRPVGGASLLAHAAMHGQLDVVRFLLDAPCATSIKDRLTAMHAAVEAGHYRVASLLETGRDRPYLHALRHLRWRLERRGRERPRA